MPSRPFDGVLIDFYGTIAAGDREAVEATCKAIVETLELPISAPQFAIVWGERYFQAVGASNHDSYRTLYQCELASLRETLASFNRQADPAPFLVQLEEYWHNPPIHGDAVEFLRRIDLPVCCVSNADCAPLQSAIARRRLRFDAVICSEAARCYKPEAAIFEEALRALGATPQRTLHVGDSLHSDVAGARRLGIATAWVRRESRIHDIGSDSPCFTIASLTELTPLLA
jgi:2-haloalkanoic acid dehalogenase type II